jgi:hypothetical protein
MATRSDDRAFINALREQLNGWDPLGVVAAKGPEDEHDCLLGPLTDALRSGADAESLTRLLHDQIIDHFGLPAAGSTERERRFASDLTEWYGKQRPST